MDRNCGDVFIRRGLPIVRTMIGGCSTAELMVSALVLMFLASAVETFTETPKFSQLRLLYPGYPRYGGHYSRAKLIEFIVGEMNNATTGGSGPDDDHPLLHHSTAAVRLSWTLNRHGGRHAIGTEPIRLSTPLAGGRGDSFAGRDGQQYIFRNAAFGPFLAARYGNPVVSWGVARPPPPPSSGAGSSASETMAAQDGGGGGSGGRAKKTALTAAFRGRQGIVRVVSYRRQHEDGHVALWDCTRFHESRDWTNETHVIAVEFWESADSYCAPEDTASRVPPVPRLQPIDDASSMRLVPRGTLSRSKYLHEQVDDNDEEQQQNYVYRHHKHGGGGRRGKNSKDTIWIQ